MLDKKRLLELAAVIEGTPEGDYYYGRPGFNMRTWSETVCPTDSTPCGTVVCIGGMAEALFANGLRGKSYEVLTDDRDDDYPTLKALFYPGYPNFLNDDGSPGWYASPAQAARVIRHLVATGEVRWDAETMGPE